MGIEGCYQRPNECESIAKYVKRHIDEIKYPELDFIDTLSNASTILPKYYNYCTARYM